MHNGIIEEWIVVSDIKFTEAGWCKVDHQSTENFTIGTLIEPNIAIRDVEKAPREDKTNIRYKIFIRAKIK